VYLVDTRYLLHPAPRIGVPLMAPRGTIARPSVKRWSKSQFVQQVNTFLRNKAMLDTLTFENQGDKKKEIPGLRDTLLLEVRQHGEEDPETGSVYLRLEDPITMGSNTVAVVKAEARGWGKKHIVIDKAVKVLKAKSDKANEDLDEGQVDYVEDVTRYRVTLPLLTLEQYDRLEKALKKARLEDLVEDEVEALISEDAILEMHFDGDLEEDELDSMYEPDDIVWALTFQS
jgi:hypothetical protein